MSDNSGGGGPGKPPPQPQQQQQTTKQPGQVSGTSAWAGTGALGGKTNNMRDFNRIIEEEKANRNIIEINLTMITTTDSEGTINKPRYLKFDDLGELIFDVLKIDAEHCLSFDYTTGRYDTRQIKLKPNIDTDQYVTQAPIIFK